MRRWDEVHFIKVRAVDCKVINLSTVYSSSIIVVALAIVVRKGMIDLWSDTKIVPGANWREEIKRAVEMASVGVLLVSADFLASKFIAENELPPLLRSAKTRGTVILSVILSPCQFDVSLLAQFQAVNHPSKPSNRSRILV